MSTKRSKQREFGFVNWGGTRRGAGRKAKGERAGVSHRPRAKLDGRQPVLVTMRVAAGLPSLRCDAHHELVRGAIEEASERGDFQVIVYSVQTNHVHLVVEARSSDALARGMNALGARVAKRLNRLWRRSGKVFPDRFHSRALKTPRECRIALIYVLQNARKHGSWRASPTCTRRARCSSAGLPSRPTPLDRSARTSASRARGCSRSAGGVTDSSIRRRCPLPRLHEAMSGRTCARRCSLVEGVCRRAGLAGHPSEGPGF